MKSNITVNEALEAILERLSKFNLSYLHASTSLIIIPGYDFKMINGIILTFTSQKVLFYF